MSKTNETHLCDKEITRQQMIDAEIIKQIEVMSKINAQITKLAEQPHWYPLVTATVFVFGIIALTKIFL